MSGPQCCENPPNISSTFGKGSLQEIAGLNTYISGDQDSTLAIILACDAFGYESVILRKIADKVAGAGFLVVVPDYFYGDPLNMKTPREVVPNWLKTHSPGKGCEDTKKIIAELRSRGIYSVGAAGFCWGGMAVVSLAKYDDIQAAVILHPGPITADEINDIKVPTAILGAEFDDHCKAEEIKHFGEILSAKPDVEGFAKVYPGTVHGWASRYNEEDETAVKNAEEAHNDMLNWFIKYVK